MGSKELDRGSPLSGSGSHASSPLSVGGRKCCHKQARAEAGHLECELQEPAGRQNYIRPSKARTPLQ